MLKLEVRGDELQLEAAGSAMQLVEDIAFGISDLYAQICIQNSREDYRLAVKAMIQDIFKDDSPVWDITEKAAAPVKGVYCGRQS